MKMRTLLIVFNLTLAMYAQSMILTLSDWEPYVGEALPDYGCASKAMTRACKLAGVECIFVFEGNWKRVWLMVASQEAHGTFPWTNTAQRDADMQRCETPLLEEKTYIYYLKKDFPEGLEAKTFSDIKNVSGIHAVVVRGFVEESYLKEIGIPYHVVNTEPSAWKMMEKGRVNLYASPELSAKVNMAEYTSLKLDEDIGVTGPVRVGYDYYYFSKNNKQIDAQNRKICQALKEMHESGELQNLTKVKACLE